MEPEEEKELIKTVSDLRDTVSELRADVWSIKTQMNKSDEKQAANTEKMIEDVIPDETQKDVKEEVTDVIPEQPEAKYEMRLFRKRGGQIVRRKVRVN